MNKRIDKIMDGVREPVWKIPVKAMCACGEEVTEQAMSDLKEEIKIRLLYAIPKLLDNQDLERAAESIYALIMPFHSNPKRWRPKQGDEYFKIDSDGMIHKITWHEDVLDRTFWAFGNCFQTYAQAELARGKVKEVLLNFYKDYGK
jgi:hypothetical protein